MYNHHPDIDPALQFAGDNASPHEFAKGRMALPFPGYQTNVFNVGFSESSNRPMTANSSMMYSQTDEEDDGEFVIDESLGTEGMEEFDFGDEQWQTPATIPTSSTSFRTVHSERPPLVHSQSLQLPPQKPMLNRYTSHQGSVGPIPGRSASPHVIQGDVFAAPPSPMRRAHSAFGMMGHPNGINNGNFSHPDRFTRSNPHAEGADLVFRDSSRTLSIAPVAQGISPMRALGPPPQQPIRFVHHNVMITPDHKNNYESHILSSATSSTADTAITTDMSSGGLYETGLKRRRSEMSEDGTDSPTRPNLSMNGAKRLSLRDTAPGPSVPKPAPPIGMRPQRLATKPPPTMNRTVPKPTTCAEDPGVEGIPEGEKSMDRPTPSFACIIGQAILRSSAGGLSLEHIYRYVETAFPYFQTGDGAWRNSVRHNLSIHKMFKTIPRTERHPPGKGGIWVIEEDEKCHWPEENKFIKNFPSNHPHHANCLQTLHEQRKEAEAMAKAAADGVEYVPKKGKKGRKAVNASAGREEDHQPQPQYMSQSQSLPGFSMEMMRSTSAMSDTHVTQLSRHPSYPQHHMHPPPLSQQLHEFRFPSMSRSHSSDSLSHPHLPPHPDYQDHPDHLFPFSLSDLEDEGEFLPEDMLDEESYAVLSEITREEALAKNGMMVPSRLERALSSMSTSSIIGDKRPQSIMDSILEHEDLFHSTKPSTSMREPLSQRLPIPQETIDDNFVTPERDKQSLLKSHFPSSAFKTPALINTASSPGSSPMPLTVTRNPTLPSSLSHAWTLDDAMTMNNKPMLEDAFDLQPQGQSKKRVVSMQFEEDSQTTQSIGFPKTPVSRSSAATGVTPGRSLRTPKPFATPMIVRSPGSGPSSVSEIMSTPMWEIGGCLARLRDLRNSPSNMRALGSPGSIPPPTSPIRYSLSLDASPKKTPV
ncbi:hypothetical protein TREMEDRAFT_63820 [Tremella mesenterica DSM 1558]|uniref:uncharacterized protein n=1 Tax=Tremella mesenterica (strain ATCC 24925 / CBS 8224 / DSM 1558 / NBRC 9311 / NRRL Y-6157 / RJB 2259-6 / UBC 559-6) TaxID=578456 RepID=UPI0003F490D0|nr:uncharacterized protein TREMEDRAFT_63820 [Tremella mesenterica DSM 1558]EIW67932.1 hypothetical protein TREMEDRAFT_63820 [Tremella mesenterica DSM 1558]